METISLEKITPEDVYDHIFDVLVTHAPPKNRDLGAYERRDGQITVDLKVPVNYTVHGFLANMQTRFSDLSGSSKKKKSRKIKSSPADKRKSTTSGKGKKDNGEMEISRYGFLQLELTQSMSLFTSSTETSTTGAMLWNVSVLFVEWILNISQGHVIDRYIPQKEDKEEESNTKGDDIIRLLSYPLDQWDVVELGCGSAGLVCCALGPITNSYIATDHLSSIVKSCHKNVLENVPAKYVWTEKGEQEKLGLQDQEDGLGHVGAEEKIRTLEFDWEDMESGLKDIKQALGITEIEEHHTPTISETNLSLKLENVSLNEDANASEDNTKVAKSFKESFNSNSGTSHEPSSASNEDRPLVVIACDTVYNEHLIPHFLNAMAAVCKLRPKNAHAIVAQQVRDSEIMGSFMEQFVEKCLDEEGSIGSVSKPVSHKLSDDSIASEEPLPSQKMFDVYTVPDSFLSKALVNGYTVHYAKCNV